MEDWSTPETVVLNQIHTDVICILKVSPEIIYSYVMCGFNFKNIRSSVTLRILEIKVQYLSQL